MEKLLSAIGLNVSDFIAWCDYLGTAAFAISGIRLAAAKRFDWFGALVVGVVTAVGGGTVRDLMLDVTPFWMEQVTYLFISLLALIFTIAFRKYIVHLHNTLFFFDAIGIGLFTVVGVSKTIDMGFPWWVAIVMGTITGSFGGMIRDILINEQPLIFRKDIYAIACIVGGVVYVLLDLTPMPLELVQFTAAISTILTRVLAVRYHISIPTFKGEV